MNDSTPQYRYDLSWFNGPRIALIRMDTADQRFSTNATLMGYVVTPHFIRATDYHHNQYAKRQLANIQRCPQVSFRPSL